jgi:hypothetical protein
VRPLAVQFEGGKVTQAKRAATKTGSSAKTTSGRAQSKRSSAGSSAAKAAAISPEALEAAAERVRTLNERIIKAGKQAGGITLSSYETALQAIASAVERGPGSSEIDWIAQLATAQAKFIRDVTEAWTSAARGLIK